MSALPDARAVSISTAGYEDGLGRRSVRFDREVGGMLECLRLRPQLRAFEASLRERAEVIGRLDDERFVRVRSVERDPQGLTVVSELVAGERLLDVIEARQREAAPVFGIDAALGLLLQLLPALSTLHTAGLVHGLVSPGRLLVTPASQVVLLDSIYAAAVERLNLNRSALWTTLGLLASPVAGAARLDRQTDVIQAALSALIMATGKTLDSGDGAALTPLVRDAAEVAEIRAGAEFAVRVRQFFTAALPLSGRRPVMTTDDAMFESRNLAALLGEESCHAALSDLTRAENAGRVPTASAPPEPKLVIVQQAVKPRPDPEQVGEDSTPASSTPVQAPTAGATPVIAAPAVAPKPALPPIEAPPIVESASIQALPPVAPPPVTPPPSIPDAAAVIATPPVPPPPTASPTVIPAPAPPPVTAAPAPRPVPVAPVPVAVVAPAPVVVPAAPPAPLPMAVVPPAPVVAPPAPIRIAPPAPPIGIAPTPPVAVRVRQEPPTGYTPVRPEPDPAARALPFVDRGTHEEPSRFPWKIAAAALVIMTVGILAGRAYLPSGRVAPATAVENVPEVVSGAGLAPTPSRAATTGGLTVESQPAGATVTVDGREVGATPLTIDALAPGRHAVTISTPTATVRRTVRVEAGRTITLDVPVYSGWVAVFSPISLNVVTGGRTIGNTETGKIMLPPGTHVLTLSNRELGYTETRSVEIHPGEERPLNVEPKSVVNINAHPWAEVWVDGRKAGDTPIANLSVLLGTRVFVFKHPQFGERRVTTTITAKPSAITVDLTRPE